jgi:hypothetical protein
MAHNPRNVFDLVTTVVSMAPVPYLSHAFQLLGYLQSSIQQVQTCKAQLGTLVYVAAGYLKALNERCLGSKITYGAIGALLADLERYALAPLSEASDHVLVSLLDEVNRFVAKRLGQNIIKTLLGTPDTMEKIQDFYVRLNGVFQAFQVRNSYSKASV